ncbi:unnamed protein product [Coffea canephora]|uniref:DH200=94 genomic scaffold, scaffold_1131 n=1 Tax=Coffea canephora TaxID=49390 RepID=A0A068VIC7_COFCA|nr:unnamed protein product [Coffea canephora]
MELLLLFIFLLLSCLTVNFFPPKSKAIFNSQLPPGTTSWPINEKILQGSVQNLTTFRTNCCFRGAAANKFLFSNENKLVSLAWPRNIRKIFPYSATPTTTIADSSLKLRVMLLGFLKPDKFAWTSFYRGIKAAHSIRKKLLGIIRQRKMDLVEKKSCHADDLSSYLLTVPDDGGKFMSELETADKIWGSIIGSQDSTTTAITFVMKYLAEFPDIYDEVLKEQRSIAEKKIPGEPLNWKDPQNMKYAWNVACEVLRLVPPIQGNFREALTDFTFSTFFIPKGWKLNIFVYIYWTPNTTHKNPEYFPQPEKFDPSRFEGTGPIPYAYIPFGGGPRICPGKDIARLVILVFIYNVVGKFRWEKLIPDENTVVVPVPLPAKGLPIRLYPHST